MPALCTSIVLFMLMQEFNSMKLQSFRWSRKCKIIINLNSLRQSLSFWIDLQPLARYSIPRSVKLCRFEMFNEHKSAQQLPMVLREQSVSSLQSVWSRRQLELNKWIDQQEGLNKSTYRQLAKSSSLILRPHPVTISLTNWSIMVGMPATDNTSKYLNFLNAGRISIASILWQSSIYNSLKFDPKESAIKLMASEVRRVHWPKLIDRRAGADITRSLSPLSDKRQAPLRDTMANLERLFEDWANVSLNAKSSMHCPHRSSWSTCIHIAS